MAAAHPPPRLSWSKELDLRLVRAIRAELGIDAEWWRVSSPLDWSEVWCRVKSAEDEAWPAPLTTKELKKRWDETLRIWFNKSLPAAERSGKRASEVHIGRLLELLARRDYDLDSRPGPKRRKREDDSESSEEETAADPLLDRLEGCLSVLRTAAFQRNFRLHTESGLVLEPQVLLDLANSKAPLKREVFLTLARVFMPLCDVSDHEVIRQYLAQRRSFVILAPAAVGGEARLLVAVAVFPEACLYSVPNDPALGLPPDLLSGLQLRTLDFDKTTDMYLLALYLVSGDLTWPGSELARTRLLSKFLLSPVLDIRGAPPIEPLQLPSKSLLACLEACGVQLPAWFTSTPPRKRADLLSGIRDLSKAAVLLVPLDRSAVTLSWQRGAEDKQLFLLAERGPQAFGAILRIVFGAEQATLTLLANPGSVTELSVRNHHGGLATLALNLPTHTITPSAQTVISMRVNDIHVGVALE